MVSIRNALDNLNLNKRHRSGSNGRSFVASVVSIFRSGMYSWCVCLSVLFVCSISLYDESLAGPSKRGPAKSRNAILFELRNSALTSAAAVDALERAAVAGEATAQFFFGTLFDPSILKWPGPRPQLTESDFGKAINWYEKAARRGHQLAISNAANLRYMQSPFQDFEKSCSLAKKLHDDAHEAGLMVRAECLNRALGGTELDKKAASRIYELLYNRGHARAGAILGWHYQSGEGGRERNIERAIRLYKEMAGKGDLMAMHNLAGLYDAGTGVVQDPKIAARWITTALDSKYDFTIQTLTSKSELFTTEFWSEIQRYLAKKGLYDGPIDGVASSATLDAIKQIARN